jgi:hypothetical protein
MTRNSEQAAAVLGRASHLMTHPGNQAAHTLRSEFDAATLAAGLELATRLRDAAAHVRAVADDFGFFDDAANDLTRAAALIEAAQSAAIPLH